jgi:hypothetical protein
VSSLNSITSGAENFLKELISPINEACKYSVDSTLSFKTKFFEFSQSGKFNSEEFEVISYDCQSLYTSINIQRVLKFILDTIYNDTEKFFPKRSKTVKILKEVISQQVKVPPRETLEKFFLAILTEFSTFQALNGFFRQINGVSMGGKLSPSFANIFCHMFEIAIIDEEIQNGCILAYYRYVDDILVVIKKDKKIELLEKLNRFDKNLGFTMENASNNTLNFLDTTVIINNNNLNLEHFRKPTATDCLVNYRTGVSPKNYKIGTFVGELYRCHHSTTTDDARDRAIEKSKNIFLKNQYPLNLLNSKISEVRERNFQKSDFAKKRQAEIDNPDFENYTFSLPYTSTRCSSIASKIHKIINQFTPNYKLNIAFTTIKLDSVIHPRLKPQKSYFQNCNLCYKYICECEESYIGETQQLLHTRVKNHRTRDDSVIHHHIQTCSAYQQSFYDELGVDHDNSTDREKLDFFEGHFTIIEKNLIHKNSRKIFEGMLICMDKPTLNRQKEHKVLKFICTCFLGKSQNTAIT